MHSHKAGALRDLKEQRNHTKKLCQQMRYQGLKSVAWVLHTNGDLPGYLKIRQNRGLLVALVQGWRVRRIMRTKEVVMRIEQIFDFQNEIRKGNQDQHM